jgi:folate-binding protein YgfZ
VSDLAADYELLHHDVGAIWLKRDFIAVQGPDAASFLQGQCSQDLGPLAVGQSAWSLILQPQGKVDALVRITRVADDGFVVDVDKGYGEAVTARLNRFKLRIKADIQPLEWRCVALRGPKATTATATTATAPDGHFAVAASWPGLEGIDIIGPDPSVPDGITEVDKGAFEVVRIEAGVPAMGRELTERTIPAEAGIVEQTVSFTKGCFTGQELVARIDSRGGHVPRHLRGVVLDDLVPVESALHDPSSGKQVGTITSVAARPDGAVALSYLGRDVEPPAEVTVTWEGGQSHGRVEALPLRP